MANNIIFTCTSLINTGKTGVIKPNENGGYPQVVGALGVFNSQGQYYPYEEARALFESSSSFQRRVKRGALLAEVGHPMPEMGWTDTQYATRLEKLDEKNQCAFHAQITLDFENVKGDDGKPIIAIVSEVHPAGVHGAMLRDAYANPKENVFFSIRAFSEDSMRNGIYRKVLRQIITFDKVTEPGIKYAEKFKSPSLETYMEKRFTRAAFERAMEEAQTHGIAAESIALNLSELYDSMGWSKSRVIAPPSLAWSKSDQ